MDDWKHIVAANLSSLRKAKGLTQLQLADQLHYSDKAVSKWERGESLPDLAVMKQLADFYGVLIDDFLLTPEQRDEKRTAEEQTEQTVQPDTQEQPIREDQPVSEEQPVKKAKVNRIVIVCMAAMLVWLIASMVYVVLDAVVPEMAYSLFLFIYATPITAIVLLVFNSIWFNPRWNYIIISFLVWSLLGALFLTFYFNGIVIWKLFLIGIPAQLIIFLWSRLCPASKS